MLPSVRLRSAYHYQLWTFFRWEVFELHIHIVKYDVRALNPIPKLGGWGGFPHTSTQCSNTSWLSYNSTQIWHHLPGDSIRCHKLRVQSYKTGAPPHLRGKQQVQVVTGPLTDWLQIQVPRTASLGLINLLEWLTGPRKAVYSLDYQFITEDTGGYESTVRWRETQGGIPNKGASILTECGTWHGGTCKHFWVTNPEAPWTSFFWVFMRSHYTGMFD